MESIEGDENRNTSERRVHVATWEQEYPECCEGRRGNKNNPEHLVSHCGISTLCPILTITAA